MAAVVVDVCVVGANADDAVGGAMFGFVCRSDGLSDAGKSSLRRFTRWQHKNGAIKIRKNIQNYDFKLMRILHGAAYLGSCLESQSGKLKLRIAMTV